VDNLKNSSFYCDILITKDVYSIHDVIGYRKLNTFVRIQLYKESDTLIQFSDIDKTV